jgi:RNA polymerase sigma factor (TIGR02999 family)
MGWLRFGFGGFRVCRTDELEAARYRVLWLALESWVRRKNRPQIRGRIFAKDPDTLFNQIFKDGSACAFSNEGRAKSSVRCRQMNAILRRSGLRGGRAEIPVCKFRPLPLSEDERGTKHRSVRRPISNTKPQAVDEIRKILEASQLPGGLVSSELLPLVYDELRALAAKRLADESVGQTLQATALVHEAWLSVAGNDERIWTNRGHFFGAAALAMRHILVDRARAKGSQKRGGNPALLQLESLDIADVSVDERVLMVDEMMTRLEQDDPDSVRVITLKFFGGLTNKEIAMMDGVTERTIERHWAFARTKLFRMIHQETGEGFQG